jgi:hypothetical protein
MTAMLTVKMSIAVFAGKWNDFEGKGEAPFATTFCSLDASASKAVKVERQAQIIPSCELSVPTLCLAGPFYCR